MLSSDRLGHAHLDMVGQDDPKMPPEHYDFVEEHEQEGLGVNMISC